MTPGILAGVSGLEEDGGGEQGGLLTWFKNNGRWEKVGWGKGRTKPPSPLDGVF